MAGRAVGPGRPGSADEKWEEARSSTAAPTSPTASRNGPPGSPYLKVPASMKYTSLASFGDPAPSAMKSTRDLCARLLCGPVALGAMPAVVIPGPAPSGPLLEGWVMKRSKRLHIWRRRWASLWVTGSGERLDFSVHRDYTHVTESFPLRCIRAVRAVSDFHYRRPSCMFVECITSATVDEIACRLIGLQFDSDEERDSWLAAVSRASRFAAGAGFKSPPSSRGTSRPASALLLPEVSELGDDEYRLHKARVHVHRNLSSPHGISRGRSLDCWPRQSCPVPMPGMRERGASEDLSPQKSGSPGSRARDMLFLAFP